MDVTRALAGLEAFAEELRNVAEANADAVNWGGPTIRKELKVSDGRQIEVATEIKAVVEHTRKLREALERLDRVRKIAERDKTPVPHWVIIETCEALNGA